MTTYFPILTRFGGLALRDNYTETGQGRCALWRATTTRLHLGIAHPGTWLTSRPRCGEWLNLPYTQVYGRARSLPEPGERLQPPQTATLLNPYREWIRPDPH
jgi:hypothetical protein